MEKSITRDQLITQLIELVTTTVNLGHLDKSKMNSTTRLTRNPNDGSTGTLDPALTLGLDSVDILEVVVVVEHRFGIKINNAEDGKKIFSDFGNLADYLLQK